MLANAKRLVQHEASGQFVRYAIIGIFNTVVSYTIFRIVGRTVLAFVVAFVLVNTMSFLLNKRWAFRDERREAVHRQYVVFLVLTLVGLGLLTGTFRLLLIPLARYSHIQVRLGSLRLSVHGRDVAFFGSIPVGVLWNFTAYRRWIFRSSGSPASV